MRKFYLVIFSITAMLAANSASALPVTRLLCEAGGGAVTLDGGSGTGLSCHGGKHDGKDVNPNSLKRKGGKVPAPNPTK